jgi:hypothetical protein
MVFEHEIEVWLRTWDHSGVECECDACNGIVISLHWILQQQWPAIELTRIVGWLRAREQIGRKNAPSYYRRKASRIKGWDRRLLERFLERVCEKPA